MELFEEVIELLEMFYEVLGKVDDIFKFFLDILVDDFKEKVWWYF